jgi:L-rhamnonate dehydratase
MAGQWLVSFYQPLKESSYKKRMAMKISEVKVFVTGPRKSETKEVPTYRHSWLVETEIANPMSIHEEYRPKRSLWLPSWGRVIVQVIADDGTYGLGESAGGNATAEIIVRHLKQFLIGKNPFEVERLWDIMFRASLPYGRKGAPIMAISAVDFALWDLISKKRGEPLYQSLGGLAKDSIQAYLTGNSIEETKGLGFMGHKLAMPFGPASGRKGMDGNVALVKESREQIGWDAELMLDCYMAWDVEYTIRIAELIEPYRVKWIEETLPPDDYVGYGILRKSITSSAIATGEHEYTRYGFQALLDARGAGILQPDIAWCGGLTEAKKICALASAQAIPVIPHAGGLQPWAIHLLFAEVGIPYAEYFIFGEPNKPNPDPIFAGIHAPQNGWFTPPPGIGAGIDFTPDAHEYLYEITGAYAGTNNP